MSSALKHDLSIIQTKFCELKLVTGSTYEPEDTEIEEFFGPWNFELGQKDYSLLLDIVERPYGRENSTEQLIEEYEKWIRCDKSDRNGTLICLSGERGCGENIYWNHLCQYIIVNDFCARNLTFI